MELGLSPATLTAGESLLENKRRLEVPSAYIKVKIHFGIFDTGMTRFVAHSIHWKNETKSYLSRGKTTNTPPPCGFIPLHQLNLSSRGRSIQSGAPYNLSSKNEKINQIIVVSVHYWKTAVLCLGKHQGSNRMRHKEDFFDSRRTLSTNMNYD